MRHALSVVAVLASLRADPAGAADWTDAVFPERSHDFGTVARGSKVRHSFKLVNSTNQEIHIASWRTKCGCTDVRVGARDIPPGTQTVIEAVDRHHQVHRLQAVGPDPGARPADAPPRSTST